MKKRLIRIAAIILLLLVFFIGFLQVRQYRSYRKCVHNKATGIIKISIDDIAKTMAFDFISHPSYYINLGKGSKEKDTTSHKNGINIPANVFIYTVAGKSTGTFFCSLPLSDAGQFRAFAGRELHVDSFTAITPEILLGISSSKALTVAYNKDRVAFAYSLERDSVTDILEDLLTGTDILQSDDSIIQKLKKAEGHIAYLDGNNTGSIHFGAGKVSLHAEVLSGFPLIPGEHGKHRELCDTGIANMWLDAQLRTPVARRDFHIKDFSLNVDSLLNCYKGYVDIEMKGSIMQTDSVVTYGYDDNFEAKEEWTVKENRVPQLLVSFKSDAGKAFHYLLAQDVIKDKGVVNKDLFPLYSLYASQGNDYINFSTDRKEVFAEQEVSSDYFFSLSVDLDKLRAENLFPFINEYIARTSSFILHAKKGSSNAVLIDGVIDCSDKKINALSQLKL